MIKYGFFNSVNNDRVYNADDISNFFSGILTNGIFKNYENELEVIAATGMNVTVKSGKALINYKYIHNTSNLTLAIDTHSSYDRLDYIVAYSDLNTRTCGIKVVKGLQSGTSSELENTTTYTVIKLASVFVGTTTTSIDYSNITDLRAESWLQFSNLTTSFSQNYDQTSINNLWYDDSRNLYYVSLFPMPRVGTDVINVYFNGALAKPNVDYYFLTSIPNEFRVYFQNNDLTYAIQHQQSFRQYIIVETIINQAV